MSKSFLESGSFFSSRGPNPELPEIDEEGIHGSPFQYGIGMPLPLDEKLIHVSHLAATIFSHRRMPGDDLPISAGAAVEAAWDIFNRTKVLVDEAEAEELAEAQKLLEQLQSDPESE